MKWLAIWSHKVPISIGARTGLTKAEESCLKRAPSGSQGARFTEAPKSDSRYNFCIAASTEEKLHGVLKIPPDCLQDRTMYWESRSMSSGVISEWPLSEPTFVSLDPRDALPPHIPGTSTSVSKSEILNLSSRLILSVVKLSSGCFVESSGRDSGTVAVRGSASSNTSTAIGWRHSWTLNPMCLLSKGKFGYFADANLRSVRRRRCTSFVAKKITNARSRMSLTSLSSVHEEISWTNELV